MASLWQIQNTQIGQGLDDKEPRVSERNQGYFITPISTQVNKSGHKTKNNCCSTELGTVSVVLETCNVKSDWKTGRLTGVVLLERQSKLEDKLYFQIPIHYQ